MSVKIEEDLGFLGIGIGEAVSTLSESESAVDPADLAHMCATMDGAISVVEEAVKGLREMHTKLSAQLKES